MEEFDVNRLMIGLKVMAQKSMEGEIFYRQAEILSRRVTADGKVQYYVHYVDFNKRLDEWIDTERIDLSDKSKIELPKSKKKGAANSGISKDSAPSTPIPATPVQASAQKRKKASSTASRKKTVTIAQSPSVDSIPSTPLPKSDSSEALPIMDADDSTVPQTPSLSAKQQEIENLRHGGSMTQHCEEVARVKNFDKIQLGRYIVSTWYFSSYPEEYTKNGIIYICEFCLCYFGCKISLQRHCQKCTVRYPPGLEIYRKDELSFWELDGHKQKEYCRNLCLLSKLFLDHKTLYYDVDPFLFYILTERDEYGCHIVGYFSKEKESADNYNVACILTLPQHQRKGYGRLLISFSYELSKRENKTGSPEKPLSDLGLLSYRSFWAEQIMKVLKDFSGEISIETISSLTAITCDDILHTIQAMGLLKYYKGSHIILLNKKAIKDYEKSSSKQKSKIDPKCIQWTPPNFTPAQLKYV